MESFVMSDFLLILGVGILFSIFGFISTFGLISRYEKYRERRLLKIRIQRKKMISDIENSRGWVKNSE